MTKKKSILVCQTSIIFAISILLSFFSVTHAEIDKVANASFSIRAISYNVMYFHGYPAERIAMQGFSIYGSSQDIVQRVRNQIPIRIALELALYAPDIISLQEARGEDKVAELAEYLGMNYAYFPRSQRANFPGAIITKYEILESQSRPVIDDACPPDLFTRHWGRVLIQTEIGKIAVHTAHLMPHVSGTEIRTREITEMLRSTERDINAGYSVLILGDLNHQSNVPEYKLWIDAGFIDTWAQKNEGESYTFPSTGPRSNLGENYRIDYIFAHGLISDYLIDSQILYYGAFFAPPETSMFALSDHLPVMTIFGSVKNLSHFLL